MTEAPAAPTAILEKEEDTIAAIQSAAHISPFEGQSVSGVEGVVTVISSDGFYMQSMAPDDDLATSEGIFVFTDTIPTVDIGDAVQVDGRVTEMTPGGGYGNLSRTQINHPEVSVLSSGNDLPEPTVIGEGGRIPPTEVIDDDTEGFISESTYFDPEEDGLDFYESMEGMLVQVNDAVVVGPTNRFKEIVVLGDFGALSSVRTPRGGIVIRPDDFNPERIILDDLLVETPFVKVGDVATEPIVGVMDYDYGNFKFLPTESPQFEDGGLEPEPGISAATEGELRVVSYNVLNLSAQQPDRMAELADQIVNRLGSPDIIGLQEIMDNDGSEGDDAVSADLTYQGIINAILDLGGPQYGFVDIDPVPGAEGGIPLGNIRVGFLYRLDTGLQLFDAPPGESRTPIQILDENEVPTPSINPGRIEPNDSAFFSSRRSLVLTFDYRGERLFLVNNHFASKGGDRSLFGEFQPPILDSEAQRLGQAQAVHDFVTEILAIDPDARVIVFGDLNDFQFSNPIKVLEGEILSNLIETLPEPERYTYIYDGNSQALDHILISDGFAEFFVSIDIMHINSEFGSASQFSDHDPLIAIFEFAQ
ncbi:MAG: endonuclease/exonuclease/phosphatase family protein [Brevefilum sp.]